MIYEDGLRKDDYNELLNYYFKIFNHTLRGLSRMSQSSVERFVQYAHHQKKVPRRRSSVEPHANKKIIMSFFAWTQCSAKYERVDSLPVYQKKAKVLYALTLSKIEILSDFANF